MIEISPSVLTSSIKDFEKFVKDYKIFSSIDIDIIERPFLEDETVSLPSGLMVLKDFKVINLGFHLMTSTPEKDLELLKSAGYAKKALRIYLQQESQIKFLEKYEWPEKWRKCISVKLETPLSDIDFYNKFDEVQLMSIEIGAQGRSFDESVVDKIEELREMGYNRIVSLDGGVNLRSANIIRHLDVQRVSPGSYFAKAKDLELAKMKLELALNIKEQVE